jgi:hypothetical protein
MQDRYIIIRSRGNKPDAQTHVWGSKWDTTKPPMIIERAKSRNPDPQIRQIGMSILAWGSPRSTVNPCYTPATNKCPEIEEDEGQLVAKMPNGDSIPQECLDCVTRTLGLLTEGMPATSDSVRPAI